MKEGDVVENLTLFRITGHLRKNSGGYYYDIPHYNNSIWFDKAKLTTSRQKYQQSILSYSNVGGFPFCKTKEDAYKLAMSLVENKKISLW